MDTTATTQGQQVDVGARVAEIRAHMPETYKAIQARAAEQGNEAYALVRRGLRGEPNCFYAMERGWVMGTPFNLPGLMGDVAVKLVGFGWSHMVMWPEPSTQAQQQPQQGA